MSQDKTIIPGMMNRHQSEPNKTPDGNTGAAPKTKVSPVAEPAEHTGAEGVTKIIETAAQNPKPAPAQPEVGKADKRPAIYIQDRPIVGILVSTSNGGKMELFPLYLGRNIIGRAPKADILLDEETVSQEQAVIVVRHLQQPVRRYIATLTDQNSTCGTYVNGQPTDFDTHILEDRDIIQFGMGYQMMFVKLDAEDLGLQANPAFKSTAMTAGHEPARHSTMLKGGPAISVLDGVTGRQSTAGTTAGGDDDEPRTVLYR